MISWVNPDENLAEKGFEDYMKEGYFAALDAIERATGEREVNAIGYCLGGTLLASTLAYMATKKDNRIRSASRGHTDDPARTSCKRHYAKTLTRMVCGNGITEPHAQKLLTSR